MNEEFRDRHKDFYDFLLHSAPPGAPQPRLRTFHRNFPEGAIYNHGLREYAAPQKIGDFCEKIIGKRNLMTDYDHDWYGYVDTIKKLGKSRLNISIHGMYPLNEEGGISRVYIGRHSTGYDPAGFARFTQELDLSEPIDHIRMITCYSASGGQNSFAAQVANIRGIPVTGFRGATVSSSVRAAGISMTKAAQLNMSVLSSQLAPHNFLLHNSQDNTWRPTALAKDFHPSFGSPGFDDMGEFLDGVFL